MADSCAVRRTADGGGEAHGAHDVNGGARASPPSAADAPDCTIGNLSGSFRCVKLAFGPRGEGPCFTLAEVEA